MRYHWEMYGNAPEPMSEDIQNRIFLWLWVAVVSIDVVGFIAVGIHFFGGDG